MRRLFDMLVNACGLLMGTVRERERERAQYKAGLGRNLPQSGLITGAPPPLPLCDLCLWLGPPPPFDSHEIVKPSLLSYIITIKCCHRNAANEFLNICLFVVAFSAAAVARPTLDTFLYRIYRYCQLLSPLNGYTPLRLPPPADASNQSRIW